MTGGLIQFEIRSLTEMCCQVLRRWWELIVSWCSMFWNDLVKPVVTNITVEPCYFLFCVGTGLYMIVSAQV